MGTVYGRLLRSVQSFHKLLRVIPLSIMNAMELFLPLTMQLVYVHLEIS